MRFPAGPVEVMGIEEAAYLVDALCSIGEKYVDKLAHWLASCHDLRDHLEASRIDCDGPQAIGNNQSWPSTSSDKPRGHVVEPREELPIVDRLRQIVVHFGREIFFLGPRHCVSGQRDDRHR